MAREKRDPAELPIEEKLKNLYSLQTILSEVDKYRRQRGELPLEVEDLEAEVEGLCTRIDKVEARMEDLQREVSDRKAVIEENNAAIAKYKEQLDNVRNSREYEVLSKEIEFCSLDVELNEKKIREASENIRQMQEDIAALEEQVSTRRTDLNFKKSELDEIISETKSDEEKLRERARLIENNIEPRLLTAFKRIRHNSRNGLGIVYVERDACGGCFNKIPPQRQLDIRMRKKIIVCEYCGRIMIDPDLAGVKLGAAAEKPKRKRASRSTKKTEEKRMDDIVPESMDME